MFGQHTREHFAQGARPDFDGTFAGFQAGADLWRLESINGHSDHIGFYVAHARASGSVHGLVDGFEGALAGHVDLDATSYGGYWTHLGPSNWYIDAVVQGTHFLGTPNSIRGVSTTVNGDAFTGSIEAGYPITLAPWLTFEPQIQGIWQRVWLDHALVPFIATISFDRADVFTGRAGALLRGTFGSTGAVWQPYLKGNVWWGSNGFDTVAFNSFGIPTGRNGGTTLEGGGGITGKLTRYVSVYGDASYLDIGERRVAHRPKGQCRPARDVVRLCVAAWPKLPRRILDLYLSGGAVDGSALALLSGISRSNLETAWPSRGYWAFPALDR